MMDLPCTRTILIGWGRGLWRTGLMAWIVLSIGCAAITNPVADGIPVRRLPDEIVRPPSREELKQIPLTLLRQKPLEPYTLDSGDVLGVFIEGVLGERNQVPPTRLSDPSGLPPATGFPIPVQEDGTIIVPFVDPIKVKGMTLTEVQEAVRQAVTVKKEVVKPGAERIIVTLLQKRQYRVLVVREDGGSTGVPAGPMLSTFQYVVGQSKRGTGVPLDLAAGENDILNAITRSGGLPGTDAKNEVLIYRKTPRRTDRSDTRIKIPLRLRPGEDAPFSAEDILLFDGDVVYLQSRDAEVFYTAGIVGTGQYPLPRDTDLDVVQAIALVRGPLVNGGFSQNAFVPQAVNTGIGNPSPSLVTVLRKTPNGQQIPIRVDLVRALQDPRERILVQPNDIIVLQEKTGEAFARYFTQRFTLNLFGTFVRQRDLTGTTNLIVP